MSNKIRFMDGEYFTEIHFDSESHKNELMENKSLSKDPKKSKRVTWDFSNLKLYGKILDIGGSGEAIISRLNIDDLTIIDLKPSKRFDTFKNIKYISMDATSMNFKSKEFDLVTSFFTFMYMKSDDIIKTLYNIHNVLKDDGELIFWDVNLEEQVSSKNIIIIPIEVIINENKFNADYGSGLFNEEIIRNLSYYENFLEKTSFEIKRIEFEKNTVMVVARKKR